MFRGRRVRSLFTFKDGRIVSVINDTKIIYELVGGELKYTIHYGHFYNRIRSLTFKKLPKGWRVIKAWQEEEEISVYISPLGKRLFSLDDVIAFLSEQKKSKRAGKENDTPLPLSEYVKMKKQKLSERNSLNLRKTTMDKEWKKAPKNLVRVDCSLLSCSLHDQVPRCL